MKLKGRMKGYIYDTELEIPTVPQLLRTGMEGMGIMTLSGVTLLLEGLWLFKKEKINVK